MASPDLRTPRLGSPSLLAYYPTDVENFTYPSHTPKKDFLWMRRTHQLDLLELDFRLEAFESFSDEDDDDDDDDEFEIHTKRAFDASSQVEARFNKNVTEEHQSNDKNTLWAAPKNTRKPRLIGPSAAEREAMLFETRPQLLHWTCRLRLERERLARERSGQQEQSAHIIPQNRFENNPLKRKRVDGLSDCGEPSRHASEAPVELGGSDTSKSLSPIDSMSLRSHRSRSSATIYDNSPKDESSTKPTSHHHDQPTSSNRQNHKRISSGHRPRMKISGTGQHRSRGKRKNSINSHDMVTRAKFRKLSCDDGFVDNKRDRPSCQKP